MRIGMLTGGGDCPGLNAVIRAVVRKGEGWYGHELVGFRHGWRGVIENETVELTTASTRGILPRGGTILGTSRTNPFKHEGDVDAVIGTIEREHIGALIAIGGEDTLGVASKLGDKGVAVVGVPKTIDNDLSGQPSDSHRSASTPQMPDLRPRERSIVCTRRQRATIA